MKIPVFLSCPTVLNERQQKIKKIIINELDSVLLEPRALGQSDYPTELPLQEVYVLGSHCSGGIILGFEQFISFTGEVMRGSKEGRKTNESVIFPTPWNQLEAGILFGLGLPLLVFKEKGIDGGIFDNGVADVFIQKMPNPEQQDTNEMREVFIKWQSRVRSFYYKRSY